ISAYNASAPVTASTTAPIATQAIPGCEVKKSTPYVGDSPWRTLGCATTWTSPAAAIASSHTAVTGPNNLPTRPVPKRWAANSPVKITAATGSTTCPRLGAATLRPSTADNTLIAGVITESP